MFRGDGDESYRQMSRSQCGKDNDPHAEERRHASIVDRRSRRLLTFFHICSVDFLYR